MYAARVSIEQVEFVAAAVQDERQLDGAWHLELLAESEEASMALRLMLDREGTVEEGELILTRENADELGVIEPGATADELDPLELELAAELGGRAAALTLVQRDDGDFDLLLELGAAQ